VAADPDRDRVYFVDLERQERPELLGKTLLESGDEPGRLAFDADGRVHVALRGSGEVVSIDVETREVIRRREAAAHRAALPTMRRWTHCT
jgi:hypothetical protein